MTKTKASRKIKETLKKNNSSVSDLAKKLKTSKTYVWGVLKEGTSSERTRKRIIDAVEKITGEDPGVSSDYSEDANHKFSVAQQKYMHFLVDSDLTRQSASEKYKIKAKFVLYNNDEIPTKRIHDKINNLMVNKICDDWYDIDK